MERIIEEGIQTTHHEKSKIFKVNNPYYNKIYKVICFNQLHFDNDKQNIEEIFTLFLCISTLRELIFVQKKHFIDAWKSFAINEKFQEAFAFERKIEIFDLNNRLMFSRNVCELDFYDPCLSLLYTFFNMLKKKDVNRCDYELYFECYNQLFDFMHEHEFDHDHYNYGSYFTHYCYKCKTISKCKTIIPLFCPITCKHCFVFCLFCLNNEISNDD